MNNNIQKYDESLLATVESTFLGLEHNYETFPMSLEWDNLAFRIQFKYENGDKQTYPDKWSLELANDHTIKTFKMMLQCFDCEQLQDFNGKTLRVYRNKGHICALSHPNDIDIFDFNKVMIDLK